MTRSAAQKRNDPVFLPLSRIAREMPWVSRFTIKKWLDEGVIPSDFVVIKTGARQNRYFISTAFVRWAEMNLKALHEAGALLTPSTSTGKE